MSKFFKNVFAVNGDKTIVPDDAQTDNTVSYEEGFTPQYEANQTTDPNALDVGRQNMNQILNDITGNLQLWQTFGVYNYIDPSLNGGTPYSYSQYAKVFYTDGNIYISREDNNVSLPTDTTKWAQLNYFAEYYDDIGSTANNYILSEQSRYLTPLEYYEGMPIKFFTTATNTSGSATVNVAGLGVKNLKLNYYPFENFYGGEISGFVEAFYDGTDFVVTSVNNPNAVNWTWASLESSTSLGNNVSSIAALDDFTIAVHNSNLDTLTTYRRSGSVWSQVGSSLSIPGKGTSSMAALSSSRIALVDSFGELLESYDFSGTAWAQVGSSLSITGLGIPSMSALSSNRIALTDSGGLNQARIYDFSGTAWAQVGSSLSLTGSSILTALNSNDIAIVNLLNDSVTTYRFDGSNFSQVGSSLSITGNVGSIILSLTPNDIGILIENEFNVFRFDGNNWQFKKQLFEFSGASRGSASFNSQSIIVASNTTVFDYQLSSTQSQLPFNRVITG